MNNENNEANQIISRLKEVFKTNTNAALAAQLGVNHQDIRNWRNRNSPPFEICIKVSNELNVDLNWLLKGQGSMYRNETREVSPSYQTKSIHDLELLFDRVEMLEQQISEIRKKA
jgi:transcriptional regulator with XRE-family HTH domain